MKCSSFVKIIGFNLVIILLSGCVNAKMKIPYYPKETFKYSNDVEINYEKVGDEGPAVIFLHGFGASIATWDDIRAGLPQKHRYYFIDLKGFGYSSKPRDNKYSFEDNSEIIISFIKYFKLKNVTLVGHSYGGGVALITYNDLRGKPSNPINKLILIDSAGKNLDYPFFVDILRKPILNHLLMKITSGNYRAKYTLERLFFDKTKVTGSKISQYSHFYSMKETQYTFVKTAEQILPDNHEELLRKIKEIKIPTLIIWGKNDPIFPVGDAYNLQKDIESSEVAIIDNCGHIPNEEQPVETAELIKEFLQKW